MICDPSGEKGPSGGWCHNVRNDVINVGNFPGTTDIHVVFFDDYQMRSITFGTHLMIQTIVSIKKRTIGSLLHWYNIAITS